jgi:hypothetical protein
VRASTRCHGSLRNPASIALSENCRRCKILRCGSASFGALVYEILAAGGRESQQDGSAGRFVWKRKLHGRALYFVRASGRTQATGRERAEPVPSPDHGAMSRLCAAHNSMYSYQRLKRSAFEIRSEMPSLGHKNQTRFSSYFLTFLRE